MQALAGSAKLSHAWQKIQEIPSTFWVTLLTVVIGVLIVVRVWRALKDFNDFAPYIALLAVMAIGTIYVVYERKEPEFLTPFVDQLAQFLPTKIN